MPDGFAEKLQVAEAPPRAALRIIPTHSTLVCPPKRCKHGFFPHRPSFMRRLNIRLDHFLTPQRTPRAGTKSWAGSCKVLGQSMALGALVGRPGRFSRCRFGGGGGWRSALLAMLLATALPTLAGEAL